MRNTVSLGFALAAAAWVSLGDASASAQAVEPTPPAPVEAQPEVVQPTASAPVEPAPTVPAAALAPPPALAAPPPADCPVCPDTGPEGAGAFLIGPGWFDLSALNDRLAAQGYERIRQPLTVIGAQGHAVLESGFVAGGMGAGIIGPSGEGPGDLQTDFSGGFGMAEFGFALVHTRAILFTLMAGVGGYGWSLSIEDPDSSSFDDALETPQRGTSLSRGGLLFGASAGLEGRVPVGKPMADRQGYFTFGVRVSGLYGPPISEWSLSDGSTAIDGPDGAMAGFYVAATLGFGGWPLEH